VNIVAIGAWSAQHKKVLPFGAKGNGRNWAGNLASPVSADTGVTVAAQRRTPTGFSRFVTRHDLAA